MPAAASPPGDTPTGPDARAALQALQGHEAWAVIRRSTRAGDRDTVGLVGGRRRVVESILDIPLEEGVPADGHIADRLLAVPFRQVRERGFEAHDDGTPLVVVDIESELEFSVAEVVDAIDDTGIEFADRGGFETDDATYADLVGAIIRDEIGQGEGANLVVGRHYRATVADWGADKALTILRRLLERERGAYWTYLFFTGDRYLVGASPERHVSIHGGDVRMNPISGTFRIPREGEVKRPLLDFLADEKEIYELFMVVDEELKMMCDICHEGGQVLGPFLKPMTHLVHTEYLLAGRTSRDVREVLRDTMYAATVTGSPVENACRLIKRYETEGRGYYGAALAILGRDARGRPGRRQPDRDPHGGRRARRASHGHGRGDPGARLGPGLRGRRDARQGRRHPQRLRPGAAGADADRRHRRAGPRRGRAAGAQCPQPAAQPVLAHRPERRRPGRRPARQVGRDPRRRGRLREHAASRARCARDDLDGGPPRGLRGRACSTGTTW